MMISFAKITHLGPSTRLTGSLIVPFNQTAKLIGNFDASDATISGLVIEDTVLDNPILQNATLSGLTEINDQLEVTGTSILNDQVWTNGSTITIDAASTVTFVGGGTLDLSQITTTLPPPTFNDVTFTGTTTVNDTLIVDATTTFNGLTTLNNQNWQSGSTIEIAGGGTVTAIGTGTLDLSAWTVVIPSPAFNNVTLNGITTIGDVNWVNGSLIDIAAADTISYVGGGTLDLLGIDVLLPASVYDNVTLTGLTTVSDVLWTNGAQLTINAGESISFVGGGELDLLGVDVLLPASVYDNVTLTGTTTIFDVQWVDGAELTINASEEISFIGGGSLDLSGVIVTLPASVFNDVTLSGTTTISNVIWTDASTLAIGAGESISYIGGGTLDLSSVAVILPASIYNNATFTGITTIDDVQWVDGANLTINAGQTINYIGGGTLNLSSVIVTLPASVFNDVTLTGTTTIDDVQWVDGANLTISAGESISYIGGGTLDLSAVIVTLPASIYNNVTLTGLTTISDVVWTDASTITIAAGESISYVGGGTLDLSAVLVTLPASIYNNVTLTGLTTIGDVQWVDGSNLTISAGETINYIGGGTLDLSGVLVTLPASIFNDVTLTGLTTIGDVAWVDGSTVTISAGESISYIGGGTLDLSAILVTLPASVFANITLTGTTTINNVQWVNGSNLTITLGETINYIGGGTLNLSGVLLSLPASVYDNVTLTGVTTIGDVDWQDGSAVAIGAGDSIAFVGGGTLDLSGVIVVLPASVFNNVTLTGTTTIFDVQWLDGAEITIGLGDSISYIGGGTLDLSAVLVILPASVFNDVTLTGTTTINDVQWVNGSNLTIAVGETINYIGGGTLNLSSVLITLPSNITLTGTTTINNVQWVNGSNLTIAAGETINYVGGGTLNLSSVLVTLPASVYNDVTLTGTTTIGNVVWQDASTVTIGAGDSISYIGGGTLDLSGVTVVLPAPVFNNVTLTGLTTIGDVAWVDGSTIDITAGETINYIGGGTLDLSGVIVTLPASVFNNVTLTGITTIGDVGWVDASTVTIGLGDSISYIGGGTLDLSAIIVTLPASVFNNVTLTGTTTINDVQWVGGSSLTITLGQTISYVGGGTIDLSAVLVTLPSNLTLTGTTTINSVQWVNGSSLTITSGQTISYVGGGTLDLSGVLVTLPASVFDNVTLTGTTTINDVQWVNGSTLSIALGESISYTGGGTLNLSAVLVTLPSNITLSGTTTINNVQWVNGSNLTISAGQTINFVGGGTLDLSAVLVTLPSSVFSNVTLTGTTTINDVQWVGGSSLTITSGQTISYVGGGTLDLSAVLVTLPASVFNNITLTGTTTINDVQWVGGSDLTITSGQTISYVGGGTLDLSAVLVTLPASVFNNLTLTGTTLIQNTLNVTAAATFSDGIDLTPTAANPRPAGDPTIWADSTTSNALRYEANPVIVSGASATVVGEIPVYTSTYGTVNSSSAGSTAVVNRVFTVNAGSVPLAMRSQATSATAVQNNFMNQSVTSNGVYLRLGRTATATIWDVGIDLANNLSNDFYIRDVVTGGAAALTITGSQMVQLRDGIELQFTKYLPQAAIPANANATSIWVSSVDATRPRWGASQELALLTDITAPTYNNVTLTGTTTVQDGLDLVPIAANPRPGGNPTIWADSTTNNALRYEANPVIVSGTAATVVGDIPVYSTTFGSVTSASGGANAAINRALTVSAGTSSLALRVQSSIATAVILNVMNQSATSYGAYVRFGRPAATTNWDVGIDRNNNLSNDFYIRDVVTGGASALTITGSQMVQLRDGIELQFSKYLPQAAIPANADATSIWVSSVDATRPRWGASQQLALLADITYNDLTLTGTTTINGTLQVNAPATFSGGVSPNYIEFPFLASNPIGSVSNLWKDSNGVLRQGASAIPSIAMSTVANTIPVVTNTNAGMTTATSTTAATLGRPLIVNAGVGSGSDLAMCTLTASVPTGRRAGLLIHNTNAGNSSSSFYLGKPFVASTSLTWEVGCDSATNNTDNFYIRHNITGIYSMVISAADIMSVNGGVSTKRYDVLTQASNPGGATTMWANSLDSALMYGANAVITTATLITIMGIQTWTGNFVIGISGSNAPTQNVAVQLEKTRRTVSMYIPSFTYNQTATVGSGPTTITFNADVALNTMLPIDTSYSSAPATYNNTSSLNQTWRFSLANRRFEMAPVTNGTVTTGTTANVTFMGGVMTWMTT